MAGANAAGPSGRDLRALNPLMARELSAHSDPDARVTVPSWRPKSDKPPQYARFGRNSVAREGTESSSESQHRSSISHQRVLQTVPRGRAFRATVCVLRGRLSFHGLLVGGAHPTAGAKTIAP